MNYCRFSFQQTAHGRREGQVYVHRVTPESVCEEPPCALCASIRQPRACCSVNQSVFWDQERILHQTAGYTSRTGRVSRSVAAPPGLLCGEEDLHPKASRLSLLSLGFILHLIAVFSRPPRSAPLPIRPSRYRSEREGGECG